MRSHFFFQYLPQGMLSSIVVLLKPCAGEVGRSLVIEGALGTAMFMIEVRGFFRVARLASSATNGTTCSHSSRDARIGRATRGSAVGTRGVAPTDTSALL